MRSTVTLDKVNALLEGRLQRPTDVLGPQTVQHQGRKMLSVRAFLPEMQQAWLLDSQHGAGRPMRRIHPAGLYEALCPLDSQHIVSENRTGPAYQLRAMDQEGEMKTLVGHL